MTRLRLHPRPLRPISKQGQGRPHPSTYTNFINFAPFRAGLALIAAMFAAPALAQPAPDTARIDRDLRQLVAPVSEQRLRRDIDTLVGFGTRHTLSSQTDPKRGIGAALRWTEAEFGRISRACGGCLQIAKPEDTVTGRRVPTPTRVWNVLAVQRGTTDPNRVIILSGHIDSRVSDVMDATKDAPGANDDGSGTALVIEAARVLSKHKFPATIVYAVLSGEEQGLLGGKILADYAKAQGWAVEANLNNDIVGNTCGSDGVCEPNVVRVFSEAVRADGGPDYLAAIRSQGGENDAPSRNLSRFTDSLADRLKLGLDVRQVWRNDRFGRGGDHSELLKAGYPAVRFTVGVEDYDHQHQDLRVENGTKYGDTADEMNFPYLAKVTRLNLATAVALARAPAVPAVWAEGAVKPDTTVSVAQAGSAARNRLYYRRTDANPWTPVPAARVRNLAIALSNMPDSAGPIPANAPAASSTGYVLGGIRIDDWVFGASSVSADGYESPVASALPGGAFKPLPPAPAARP